MAPLKGLTGLTGVAGFQVLVDPNSQATPEERLGGTADPRHAERGEQARPYSWESQMTPGGSHGPYGPENQMLGDEQWFWQPAGAEWQDPDFDHTPTMRAAPIQRGILSGPTPSGGPDDVAFQLQQSYRNHAVDMGAAHRMQHSSQGWVQQDSWNDLTDTSAGGTDMQPIGPQNMSAGFLWGTTDRVQSFARQNDYGFDSAHKHRRYADGPIPGNTYWMKPGGRPLAKTLAGPARPAIGRDSPFYGDNLGQAFSVGGAILLEMPPEYTAPPQPNLAAPIVNPNAVADSPVEWY
jgi:hypothetical protein